MENTNTQVPEAYTIPVDTIEGRVVFNVELPEDEKTKNKILGKFHEVLNDIDNDDLAAELMDEPALRKGPHSPLHVHLAVPMISELSRLLHTGLSLEEAKIQIKQEVEAAMRYAIGS